MKNICLYLFVCVCIVTGCNKMLDEKVVSSVTDEFYNTPAGFTNMVNAGYAGLRSFYSTERGMTVTVFGTDTYTNGSDGDFKYTNQYTSQLDGRYPHLREIWNTFYQAINASNAAITRADKIPDIDSTVKRSGVAQARFCRANYHFILLQLFGAVPLRLTENTEIVTEAYRDPVPDIYNAIIADLHYAAQVLPAEQSEWGRATKPAAEHLLARVYLTRATSEAKGANDYDSAAAYAMKVINNYGMSLLPDVGQVWAQGKENNAETVWAVQYTTDVLYNSTDNNASRFFLMQYDVLGGMKRDLANGTPWKRFRPTKFLLDTLYADRVHDTRYEKFFTNVWYANAGSAKLKIGDTSVFMPGYDVPDAVIATKNYQLVPPRNYTERLYPSLNKFADALRPDNQASGVRPFIAYRLAEDYFIAAEALMYTGNRTKAIEYLNTVRMRAARVGATEEETTAHKEAMKLAESQLSIDLILDERGRELVGEQLRWFDLKRTNKLLERVRLHNPQGGPNIEPKHLLRPIPQDQIDRTSNEFPQNPGY
ncbi:RagB/SusD family nutrient uptake outer membrane protein [Chitinophaga rhizophila]|uniref:RagB/SusD family nutrient uptake outer membrane protein n=1 Tax=Chitinophaga rhizophila TaxID=2866212 RepID=A0ABS7GK37_9BACT|nr:RagB/SusD family nutrient uptake outer membrane protein [Chitinophaga rhizophila]MBW8688084.1 RagB/SusD family nutrient uptake outer membrane protein [Chitinophaga rhizophila]